MSSPSLTTQILSVYIYLFIYTLATPINPALSLSLFLSAWITSLRLITGKRGKLRELNVTIVSNEGHVRRSQEISKLVWKCEYTPSNLFLGAYQCIYIEGRCLSIVDWLFSSCLSVCLSVLPCQAWHHDCL